MAEITAAKVKSLRDMTGMGMMDCKKALTEAGGEIDAAVELLRKRGLASAEKKATRETTEGLVAIGATGDGAAMVEVACETDFCARNDAFKAMVGAVAGVAAGAPAGPVEASDEIEKLVQDCFATIGENMKYARGVKIVAPAVGRYIHHNSKVGVLLGIEGDIDEQTLADLCMHVAFSNPMGISTDDIPADLVAEERRLAAEGDAVKGKPPEIVEKIVEGKLRKFLAANALLEQAFVKDEDKKVKDVLGSAKVTAMARFSISD